MDSQVISVLIGIVVVILSPWIERRFKGNKQATSKPTHRTVKRAAKPQKAPTHLKPTVTVPVVPTEVETGLSSKPATDYFSEKFEEGQRVTTDETAAELPKTPSPLKPLTTEELRRAVIWGEILRPKF